MLIYQDLKATPPNSLFEIKFDVTLNLPNFVLTDSSYEKKQISYIEIIRDIQYPIGNAKL